MKTNLPLICSPYAIHSSPSFLTFIVYTVLLVVSELNFFPLGFLVHFNNCTSLPYCNPGEGSLCIINDAFYRIMIYGAIVSDWDRQKKVFSDGQMVHSAHCNSWLSRSRIHERSHESSQT